MKTGVVSGGEDRVMLHRTDLVPADEGPVLQQRIVKCCMFLARAPRHDISPRLHTGKPGTSERTWLERIAGESQQKKREEGRERHTHTSERLGWLERERPVRSMVRQHHAKKTREVEWDVGRRDGWVNCA